MIDLVQDMHRKD